MKIALIVIAAVFAVVVLAVIGIYNALVRLRNQVDNAWSQIVPAFQLDIDLRPGVIDLIADRCPVETPARSDPESR